MLWCCITPERTEKTGFIMRALAKGFPDAHVVHGAPPDDGNPFVVWGQAWLTLRILPKAVAENRPFWHVDNGFYQPAKGTVYGNYRFTYRGLSPILLDRHSDMTSRSRPVRMKQWRSAGQHVLLAMPGPDYGTALGLDMRKWIKEIEERVHAATQRKIIVRYKNSSVPLALHLKDCWAVVTHSSNVAVDAVMAGIPVFVEPTSPAAPVGRLNLDIEHPFTPNRDHWLNSLLAQQYALYEMECGIACKWMSRVVTQVDGSAFLYPNTRS